MTPYIVTAPTALPVSIADMKAHLRVHHGDDDTLITGLQSGAVALMDGWGGALGRCIMPQVWAVDVIGPGPHALPFPDATNITVTIGGTTEAHTMARVGIGHLVTVTGAGPDDAVKIHVTYGLSPERLPAAQTLLKLMVEQDYHGLSGSEGMAVKRTIDHHISVLRWRRL